MEKTILYSKVCWTSNNCEFKTVSAKKKQFDTYGHFFRSRKGERIYFTKTNEIISVIIRE